MDAHTHARIQPSDSLKVLAKQTKCRLRLIHTDR